MMKLKMGAIRSIIMFSIILSMFSSMRFLTVSADLISDVCAKARNPGMCSRLLRSDHQARKASSPLELGKVSTAMSIYSAQSTKNAIAILRLRTFDRAKRVQYKSCETDYETALYYLRSALKVGDLRQAGRYAAAALNEPVHCRESFVKSRLSEPARLKQGNDELECLCSVVLVISNHLSGRNLYSLPGEIDIRGLISH